MYASQLLVNMMDRNSKLYIYQRTVLKETPERTRVSLNCFCPVKKRLNLRQINSKTKKGQLTLDSIECRNIFHGQVVVLNLWILMSFLRRLIMMTVNLSSRTVVFEGAVLRCIAEPCNENPDLLQLRFMTLMVRSYRLSN